MSLTALFKSKKIIYTKQWKPGVLVKTFHYYSRSHCHPQKFVRIAFPNLIKFQNHMPMTDVAFEDVTAIKKLPSPFKKWCCRLLGKKARPKTYYVKRSKI